MVVVVVKESGGSKGERKGVKEGGRKVKERGRGCMWRRRKVKERGRRGREGRG